VLKILHNNVWYEIEHKYKSEIELPENIKMIKKTGKLFSPCRRKQIKKMLSKFGFKFATES